SVTVSMAALTMGMFRRMLRVSCVCVLAKAGTTSERAGSSNTSSKVRASGTGKWIIEIFSGDGSLILGMPEMAGKSTSFLNLRDELRGPSCKGFDFQLYTQKISTRRLTKGVTKVHEDRTQNTKGHVTPTVN